MPVNIGFLIAVVGSALTALSLTGSRISAFPNSGAATASNPVESSELIESRRLKDEGRARYSGGQYLEARELFIKAAGFAHQARAAELEARNWNNAGGCSLARLNFREALEDFLKAKQTAGTSSNPILLAATLNNLASLYLQMNNPDAAMHVAREALDGPAGRAGAEIRSKLQIQFASAASALHRFDEARPIWRSSISQLSEQGDFDAAARALANFGDLALDANQISEAETALTEALRLVRIYQLNAAANVLRGLAKVRSRQGDARSAAVLFEAALAAPPGLAPRWIIYADRGEFRLAQGDFSGALSDFRKARTLALRMREDIIPADQDRIALEGALNRVTEGMVDAGNRLALKTATRLIPRETFEAAEQDRLWSLRALLPAPGDWRNRLPNDYWDLLAHYRGVERALLETPTPVLQKEASSIRFQLEQDEAKAAGAGSPERFRMPPGSRLRWVQNVLDGDSILFSFHFTETGGWVWAVDRHHVDVYPIPSSKALESEIGRYTKAIRTGGAASTASAGNLYQELFGAIPRRYLAHNRWLLELDGPLFNLPFASLVTGRGSEAVYLIERASIEIIPSALMMESRQNARNSRISGPFLGIADPIYNAADDRYHGARGKQAVVLPRLPGSAPELQRSARAWGAVDAQILTGEHAKISEIGEAVRAHPSVIHFATHVIPAPGDFSSGLIALSLDRSGAMGLMGPAEIIAQPVTAELVVLNGCHSGQGEVLPGAGLMGLTRAWIGAGAGAVLATRWEIPDGAGEEMMTDFYRSFRAHPERGAARALREAQLSALRSGTARRSPALWGAWFLLARN